jgi:protoheme IX farnesyltransferase
MNPALITDRLRNHYLPLIKSRQTFLLTLTGAAGYLSQVGRPLDWLRFLSLVGSLLLSISGCTVLNMLFDRDIDRKMLRTKQRPLATGEVEPYSAAFLGGILIALGLGWSAILSWTYFLVILAGVGMNILVYTLWLKRRSPWSIVFGGVAGGMPILAGYVLATGVIDLPGLLLTLIIIFWIPSHNLTLSTLYSDDYLNAGVPTFTNSYGLAITLPAIFTSSLLSAVFVLLTFIVLGTTSLWMIILLLISLGLVGMGVLTWVKPSQRMITFQYKYSSIYMLVVMIVLALNGTI